MTSTSIRQCTVYQSDDGRRIEQYTRVKDIPFSSPDKEAEKNFVYNAQEKVFIGCIFVNTPMGPKEIKFEIENIKDIDAAFDKFHMVAQKTIADMTKRYEEAQRKQESQIVTAPAEALNNLDSGIIIP